jgi:hypothetical protein
MWRTFFLMVAFLLRVAGYGAVMLFMHQKEPDRCLFYALIFVAEFIEAGVLVIAWWILRARRCGQESANHKSDWK